MQGYVLKSVSLWSSGDPPARLPDAETQADADCGRHDFFSFLGNVAEIWLKTAALF